MENRTQRFDSMTSLTSDTIASVNFTPNFEFDARFTILANESGVENVTDGMIWSSDCGTVMVDYGIIACVICGIAFVIGILFCLFGEKLLIDCSVKISCM